MRETNDGKTTLFTRQGRLAAGLALAVLGAVGCGPLDAGVDPTYARSGTPSENKSTPCQSFLPVNAARHETKKAVFRTFPAMEGIPKSDSEFPLGVWFKKFWAGFRGWGMNLLVYDTEQLPKEISGEDPIELETLVSKLQDSSPVVVMATLLGGEEFIFPYQGKTYLLVPNDFTKTITITDATGGTPTRDNGYELVARSNGDLTIVVGKSKNVQLQARVITFIGTEIDLQAAKCPKMLCLDDPERLSGNDRKTESQQLLKAGGLQSCRGEDGWVTIYRKITNITS